MTAAQGWYPAGVPGRERWWDGMQWTVHERVIEVPPPVAMPPAVAVAPAQIPASTPAMGWYAFPAKQEVRWWNGATWSAYKLKNGAPAADPNAIEPPALGWVLGGLFALIGLMNLSTASLSSMRLLPAVFFLAISAFWFVTSGIATARRRNAPPSTPPVFDPATRPLPGEVEGPSARWVTVGGSTQRWWTGARWANYIFERGHVRPTHFGPRAYRTAMIVAAVLAGVGGLVLVIGIFSLAAGLGGLGMVLIVGGAVFAFVGGLVALMLRVQRYASVLPTDPPAGV